MSAILTANGRLIDHRPEAFGQLTNSSDQLGSPAQLRRRLEEDGYLYLAGFLDRQLLAEIRKLVVAELAQKELLDGSNDETTVRARLNATETSLDRARLRTSKADRTRAVAIETIAGAEKSAVTSGPAGRETNVRCLPRASVDSSARNRSLRGYSGGGVLHCSRGH